MACICCIKLKYIVILLTLSAGKCGKYVELKSNIYFVNIKFQVFPLSILHTVFKFIMYIGNIKCQY